LPKRIANDFNKATLFATRERLQIVIYPFRAKTFLSASAEPTGPSMGRLYKKEEPNRSGNAQLRRRNH
jgi:hypothetical protein